MKKIMAVLLVICFISGSVLADKTPKFSDLENADWAEKYIEKSAELGLVKGYEDGTFKPNAHITKCNSILVLYRMLLIKDLVDEDKAVEITEEHTKLMDKLHIPDYGKLRDSIAYCLENDILNKKNLETFMGTAEEPQNKISREEVSYYLGRILNKELNGSVDATIEVELSDFKDADEIRSEYKPYVSLLHNIGVINGDNFGKFNPKSNITRAEFCSIVYHTLDKLKTSKRIPEKAEIIKINSEDKKITFDFINRNVEPIEKSIKNEIKIYLNDKKAKFADLQVGMNVTLIYEKSSNGTKVIEIQAEEIDKEIKKLGYVKKVEASDKKVFYNKEKKKSGKNKELTIDDNVKIFLDKDEVSFNKIRKGQHLSTEYKNDKLFAIRLTSKKKYFKGTITEINAKDDTISIKSEKDILKFDITSSCKIKKNGKIEDLKNLKVGNIAKLTSEYGKIIKLDTEPNTKFGVINGVFKGGSSKNTKNSIEISYQNDEVKTYPVDSDVDIKINGKLANNVFDLKVNSSVTLTFDGEDLIEIEARSYGNKMAIVGYIEDVDEDDEIITVQTLNNSFDDDNFTYDLLLKDALILDKKGGKTKVKHLKEWQKVFFYAVKDREADDDGVLKVEKIIILEEADEDEE